MLLKEVRLDRLLLAKLTENVWYVSMFQATIVFLVSIG